jgi:hypothetical protein
MDVLDEGFPECTGQWNKRRAFYVECGYMLRWAGQTEEMGAGRGDGGEGGEEEKGKPLFVEEDETAPIVPVGRRSEIEDIISHVRRGNALFVDEE